MNRKSLRVIIDNSVILYNHDLCKYAAKKIADAQGPNDQEENAVWCDFLDCLQEAAKATMGIDIPDLTQDDVEKSKP
tara:strand:+ start:11628 stop:11858 length:231 start_codon:yes stop_codon:yes gene_type:complete